MDLAGVGVDTDLTQAGDTQQLVLVVDVSHLIRLHGVIVVPRLPVQAVNQWALGILPDKQKAPHYNLQDHTT